MNRVDVWRHKYGCQKFQFKKLFQSKIKKGLIFPQNKRFFRPLKPCLEREGYKEMITGECRRLGFGIAITPTLSAPPAAVLGGALIVYDNLVNLNKDLKPAQVT